MDGEITLFGDPDGLKPKRARTSDPTGSHITMTEMDLSPKRVSYAQFALAVARENGSATSADVAFEAHAQGIHAFPKPNFTAHWLEDCRRLGWLDRLERRRGRAHVHVPTHAGLREPVPPVWKLAEQLRR